MGETRSVGDQMVSLRRYLKWRVILFAVLYGSAVAFVVYAMAGYVGAGSLYLDPTSPIPLFNCH